MHKTVAGPLALATEAGATTLAGEGEGEEATTGEDPDPVLEVGTLAGVTPLGLDTFGGETEAGTGATTVAGITVAGGFETTAGEATGMTGAEALPDGETTILEVSSNVQPVIIVASEDED